MNILLIEDEVAIRSFYSDMLKTAGYNVLEAGDGKEGLDLANLQPWDLLLLDIMLPQMDGLKVLQEIKQNTNLSTRPVILLTNLNSEDIVQQCMAMGANQYVVKSDLDPPDKLVDIVNIYLKKDTEKPLQERESEQEPKEDKGLAIPILSEE